MAAARFAVGDTVRFIGTDSIFTVKQYNDETCQYQVQRGNDASSVEWAFGVYLEHNRDQTDLIRGRFSTVREST